MRTRRHMPGWLWAHTDGRADQPARRWPAVGIETIIERRRCVERVISLRYKLRRTVDEYYCARLPVQGGRC